MRTLACVMIAAVLVGCGPPKFKPTKPEKDDPWVNAVTGPIKKAKDTVTGIEMTELQKTIEFLSIDGMPKKEAVVEAVKKDGNKKLTELLESGAIVLTGARQREGVWAYEKDADTKGGWVLTQNGVSKMTADEAKQAMGK